MASPDIVKARIEGLIIGAGVAAYAIAVIAMVVVILLKGGPACG